MARYQPVTLDEMRFSQPARRYIALWLGVAISMGALLGFAEYRRNPLNDSDQAWQRTGVLLPPRTYRAPAVGAVPRPGHRAILVFARGLSGQPLFHDLADQSDLAREADVIVVTSDGSRPLIESGIRHFAADADGSLARAFGLHRPIDDGPPVGKRGLNSRWGARERSPVPTRAKEPGVERERPDSNHLDPAGVSVQRIDQVVEFTRHDHGVNGKNRAGAGGHPGVTQTLGAVWGRNAAPVTRQPPARQDLDQAIGHLDLDGQLAQRHHVGVQVNQLFDHGER